MAIQQMKEYKMGKTVQEIADFPLSGTKDGKIEVAILNNPYGASSKPVATIGIFLSGGSDEPDWKVHIPNENLDAVIAALQEAKAAL
jgi:hypothetical protein